MNKLLSAYLYVFYKYYRLQRFWLDPAAEYAALAGLLIVEALNIYTVLCAADLYAGRRLLPPFSAAQSLWLLAALAVPQYFLLVHRRRYRRIAQRFAHESSRQRLVGGVAVAVYTIGSFILFVWLASLLPHTPNQSRGCVKSHLYFRRAKN
ncbi:MAG TPA: hypothetical protein VGM66_08200 [Candidatus Udaeobacter sp.]